MTERDVAVKIAWAYLGRPYIWGGDDPMRGFDCSGFIVEILKSVGALPRKGDWTAAMLWTYFEMKQVTIPYEGTLVFWKNSSDKVSHVEMCISDTLSIGASGGGSRTTSLGDAIEQNAFIKIRPFLSRSGLKGFIHIW